MEKTIYTNEYRNLLKWLKNQRENKGLTMRDLGNLLKVHHSWIGRIEQGERRLDIMEYARICDKIGCPAGEGLRLVLKNKTCRETAWPQETKINKKAAEHRPEYRTKKH